MRRLTKTTIPTVLAENENGWLAAYKADQQSSTKKYKYRHPDIKIALKAETFEKCVYCESKIGHNTPGDVEHKVPSSKDIDRHFSWPNLTIACTECNRRKNDYYEIGLEFLDPYVDDVEDLLDHFGPVVFWRPGHDRAEITIKTLELNSASRTELIARKIEKLGELSELYERFVSESNGILQYILRAQLSEMTEPSAEYSEMIRQALRTKDARPVMDWLNDRGQGSLDSDSV